MVSQDNERFLLARCVEIAFKNAPVALGADFLNACLLVFLLRNAVPRVALATWFVVVLSRLLFQAILWFRYRRRILLPEQINRSYCWFLAGLILGGVIWGSAGIFLFPKGSTTHQVFLTVVLAGMCAGTAGVFSVMVKFWLAFSLPALLPIVVRLFMSGEDIQVAIGAMAATYLVLMFLVAEHMSLSTRSLISGELEKTRLSEDLKLKINERDLAQKELTDSLQNLRTVFGGVMQAMAMVVEVKDRYTAGHQRKVADFARAIATEMNLSKEKIEGLRVAGSIHDIGKIAAPADILSKPSRLTDSEFNIIKNHSQVGYDILKPIDFQWPVADIVYQHHERMDGSGYPQGLKGDDILLEAKILAVADVVEAMLSHRPHRIALSVDEALGHITGNRGTLYDPEAVDACVRLITEKGYQVHKRKE